MQRLGVAGVFLFVASSACDNSSTPPAAPQHPVPTTLTEAPPPSASTLAPPQSSATPAAASTADSSPDDACELTREKYRKLLARGGACTKDEECAHYRGGYVGGNGGSPCGGITDTTTALALDQITRDLGDAHCQPLSALCPHHVTIPKCTLHKCM